MDSKTAINLEKLIENLNLLMKECCDQGRLEPFNNTDNLITAIQLVLNNVGIKKYCIEFTKKGNPCILLPGQKEPKESEKFCF